MKATKTTATDRPKALDTLLAIVDLVIPHRFPERTPTLISVENATTLAVAKRLGVISAWLRSSTELRKGHRQKRCSFCLGTLQARTGEWAFGGGLGYRPPPASAPTDRCWVTVAYTHGRYTPLRPAIARPSRGLEA